MASDAEFFLERLESERLPLKEPGRTTIRSAISAMSAVGVISLDDLLEIASMGDTSLSIQALILIGLLNAPGTVEPLLQILFNERADPDVRAHAAIQITNIDCEKAVEPLINATRSSDPLARKWSAYALGFLHSPRAIWPLVELLRDTTQTDSVRAQAAESLGHMVPSIRRDRGIIVSTLVSALDDPSAEVRFWSAFALGNMGDATVLPHLERLAQSDHAEVSGWWSVSKEATQAIRTLTLMTDEIPKDDLS